MNDERQQAKQVTCGNGLGYLKENMSLAVPLGFFFFYTPVLEVNFSSGSTFGFVYGVGGTQQTLSSWHQFVPAL